MCPMSTCLTCRASGLGHDGRGVGHHSWPVRTSGVKHGVGAVDDDEVHKFPLVMVLQNTLSN